MVFRLLQTLEQEALDRARDGRPQVRGDDGAVPLRPLPVARTDLVMVAQEPLVALGRAWASACTSA
jgi:hypothetical protein